MNKQFASIFVLALLTLVACKDSPSSDAKDTDTVVIEEVKMEVPDYAAFDKKVAVVRAFVKAHTNKNLEAQKAMLSDSLQWSPPMYNGNKWLGKADYVTALKAYHKDYDNLKYTEGIVTSDSIAGGMYSGSVFPESSATNAPDAIRVYGTWTAKHKASKKDIGVKWFGLIWVNDAGQITVMSEYWDVHGLAAQIAKK
jgi:hypothetical protein